MTGPFHEIRVLELAGIGPAQYGCMLLADLGADVIRVDRPTEPHSPRGDDGSSDVLSRGRRSITLDLKRADHVDIARALVARVDVLVDPFRPGVTDRLGLGADAMLRLNPRLVFAKMTGWGQEGPLAHAAGHDLNYLALSGGLWQMGEPDQPPPVPLNLVGDFGAGGMLLAFGIAAALLERERSGRGQAIDVAMVDGIVSMLSSVMMLRASGQWTEGRSRNWLQGAAPWYRPYATSDSKHITIGSLEAKFYGELLRRLGIDERRFPQWDESVWGELHELLTTRFASRPLADWRAEFEGTDVCFAPVLDLDEAAAHPHLAARRSYLRRAGHLEPAPVPRFERTPGTLARLAPLRGEHTDEILRELGVLAPLS